MAPFYLLKLDPALACEFLVVFARCEYALKVAGFAKGDENRVKPDWDLFAKTIAPKFKPADTPELANAVDYLTSTPPKKQVKKSDERIEWREVPLDVNISLAQNLLLIVRRARNNLFHGGKFLGPESEDKNRDPLLVTHSLTVLRACIAVEARVFEAYEN